MQTLKGDPGPLPLPSLLPGHLAGDLCLHVPLQYSDLLHTQPCDITDGDYQYPAGL